MPLWLTVSDAAVLTPTAADAPLSPPTCCEAHEAHEDVDPTRRGGAPPAAVNEAGAEVDGSVKGEEPCGCCGCGGCCLLLSAAALRRLLPLLRRG